MSKLKNNTRLPSRVLIAGKWWEIGKLLRGKAKGESYVPFGECNYPKKRILYNPNQHTEELLDTLMHEGLHGILAERSYKFGKLALDEDAVSLLVSDVMALLKQIAEVKIKR